jgi:hypothetical protein
MPLPEEIAAYIASQQLAGHSDDTIRNALIGAGWNQEDVLEVLPTETGSVLAVPPPRPHTQLRTVSIVAAITSVIAITATGWLLFRSGSSTPNQQAAVSTKTPLPTPQAISGSWIPGLTFTIPGGYSLISLPNEKRAIVPTSLYESLVFALQDTDGATTVEQRFADGDALLWVTNSTRSYSDTLAALSASIVTASTARATEETSLTNIMISGVSVPYRFGQPLVGEIIESTTPAPKRATWYATTRLNIPAATVVITETAAGSAVITVPYLEGRFGLSREQEAILSSLTVSQ